MSEEKWIVIGEFEDKGRVEQEKSRITEIALDLGLNPEMVISVQKKDDFFELTIHPEFFDYFQRV
ncbi:MAG: hypothetical protein Q9M37_00755 [Desulfonauticus sp.]|nr:hypothetical protein [Desulfonauticus sp.]